MTTRERKYHKVKKWLKSWNKYGVIMAKKWEWIRPLKGWINQVDTGVK